MEGLGAAVAPFAAKSELGVWIDQALRRVPVKDAQLPESDPGYVILAATACVYSLTSSLPTRNSSPAAG